jgi:hypothetical protein
MKQENNPSVTQESVPAQNTQPVQSPMVQAQTPETIAAQPQLVMTQPPKKKGCGKCATFGCVGLIALLLVCGGSSVAIYYSVKSNLSKFGTSNPAEYSGRTFSYTKKPEPTPLPVPMDGVRVDETPDSNLIEEKLSGLTTPTDSFTITQDELANAIPTNGIGISIKPDAMVVRLSVKELTENSELPGILSAFKETVFFAEVGVASDGKTIEIKKVTTGSGIMDTVINAIGKDFALQSINDALKPKDGSNVGLKKIELQDGSVKIQMEEPNSSESDMN